MWLELLPQIFEVVIIPLLGILTGFVIKFVSSKIKELSDKSNSELEKKYLSMLDDTICSCVMATTQTYVTELKKQNDFGLEAQKEAFKMTYNSVLEILSEDALDYLNESVGDLELYITQKIEAQVNISKKKN